MQVISLREITCCSCGEALLSPNVPPKNIAREEPYCLFLDELNACSLEVQKAFYSLILERRIGEYHLPDGSIVVGAGNRMQDNAITRQLPSALINRMVHVELRPSSRVWLEWAAENGIHPYVYDYLCARPDHLWSQPPKTEEPFSSPRSWHMLSDALYGCGASVSEQQLSVLAYKTWLLNQLDLTITRKGDSLREAYQDGSGKPRPCDGSVYPGRVRTCDKSDE